MADINQPSGKGIKSLLEKLFSKTVILLGVCLGLLLAWVGKVVSIFYQTNYGTLISSMGFAGLSLLLIGGGIGNQTLDKYIRFIMIILGVIIAIVALIVSTPFASSSIYIPQYSYPTYT